MEWLSRISPFYVDDTEPEASSPTPSTHQRIRDGRGGEKEEGVERGGPWQGWDLAAGAQALAAHRSRGPLAAAVDAAFFSSSSSSSSTNIYWAPTVCRALC